MFFLPLLLFYQLETGKIFFVILVKKCWRLDDDNLKTVRIVSEYDCTLIWKVIWQKRVKQLNVIKGEHG